MGFCKLAISMFILILAISLTPVASDDSLWDEFKNMEVFKIRDGSYACPLPVVGQPCPDSNAFYYFKCCGDINSNCCIRIQDWIIAIIALFLILAIVSAFVNLIRCIVC